MSIATTENVGQIGMINREWGIDVKMVPSTTRTSCEKSCFEKWNCAYLFQLIQDSTSSAATD